MPIPKRKSDLPVGAGRPYDLLEAAEMLDCNLSYGQAGMYRPMPTGLNGIDVALGGGLHAGDLAIIAGVQNIGKTAAVIQFATSFAGSDALVIIVEYEHSVTHVLERLMIQNSFVADADGHKSFNSDQLYDAYIETIKDREEQNIFNDPHYRSWDISIIICVVTIVMNIMLSIRKFGIKKSFSRIKTVGKLSLTGDFVAEVTGRIVEQMPGAVA